MTISQDDLFPLKQQFRALLDSPGGKDIVFDIIYRMIAESKQPHEGEDKDLDDSKRHKILSEDPADKSLWLRINLELAKQHINGDLDPMNRIEKLADSLSEDQIQFLQESLEFKPELSFFNVIDIEKMADDCVS